MQHQPHVQQGERNDADKQAEQHQTIHLRIAIEVCDRRFLVEAAPHLDAEVDQRDLHDRDHAEHRAAFRALLVAATETTDREVPDVGDEEERRGGEACIPLPENSPGEAAPHSADREGDRDEGDADFCAGTRRPIPAQGLLLGEQIHRRGHRGDDECEVGEPDRRHVHVQDAHGFELVTISGRETEAEGDEPAERHDRADADDPRAASCRGASRGWAGLPFGVLFGSRWIDRGHRASVVLGRGSCGGRCVAQLCDWVMRLGRLVVDEGSECQRSADDGGHSEHRQQADPLPAF